MKEITAKLVHTYINEESGATQRYYELSEPIIKGRSLGCDVDIPNNIIKCVDERIKDEFKEFVRTDGCHVICISDANIHIERLVFAAEKFHNGYSRLDFVIDGKYTFKIHGGDSNAVYDDKVYLRHLGMLNKVTIRLIES